MSNHDAGPRRPSGAILRWYEEVEDLDVDRHEDAHDAVALDIRQEQLSGGAGKSRMLMPISTSDHEAGPRRPSGAALRWLGEIKDLDVDRHERT